MLKPMLAAMTRASEKWRSIGVTAFERRQTEQVRTDLDEECEQANGPVKSPKTEPRPSKLSSRIGT